MPVVDVLYRVLGQRLPADHAYLLFSAMTAVLPEIHGDSTIRVMPVSGALAGDRTLMISPGSRLTLRVESERIAQVLPLAGKTLRVGSSSLTVGVPEVKPLCPATDLYSRLVVIKGFTEPEPFLEAVQRQLIGLGIMARASLVEQPAVAAANAGSSHGSRSRFLRRTLRIRDKEIVGFAVRVGGLTPAESITLQEKGLGGRGRFGCGVFCPARDGH